MREFLGFSLIELLIVLGIISVLIMIIYPNYLNYLIRARRCDGQAGLYLAALDKAIKFSPDGWYKIFLKNKLLIAMPLKSQAKRDLECQALTLDSQGRQGIAAGPMGVPLGDIDSCWRK